MATWLYVSNLPLSAVRTPHAACLRSLPTLFKHRLGGAQ